MINLIFILIFILSNKSISVPIIYTKSNQVMKQIFSTRSLLQNKSAQIGLGLLTCLALSNPSFAQDSSKKPTIVSTITDNGITTTTYSNGQIVKTVADGYYLDSAFYKNSNVLKATQGKRYWKLTDRVGVSIPVGNTVNGKDITMFLKPGGSNSLSVTRQWGIIGLGLTGGYQFFQVGDDYNGPDGRIYKNYDALVLSGKIPAGITRNDLKYDKISSMQDFYLLIGPSLDIPVGKKLNVNLDARGGLFNTSAPRFGAYLQDGNFGAQSLIFRMNSSASKNKLGGLVALDVTYKVGKTWALGLNAQGFITETPFTTVGQDVSQGSTKTLTKEDLSTHGGYTFGLALSHTFGEDNGKTVYTLLPPPPAPIVVYAPTILGENGKMYDYKSAEKPVFKWKSNSPNPDQEEYLFKLYKADGSDTPIYQQTTKNTSLTLPDNVALANGDEGDFYYYSVQSVVQNKHFSEADAASFGYKAKPVASITPTKPTTDQYMFKVFGGTTAPSSMKPKVRRKVTKPAVAVVPKKLVPRKKSTKPASNYVNYENVTENPKVKWPDDLPLPKNPSIYEYEVQRLNPGDCKPVGPVAKYRFYIDPKNPDDIRILPDKPKKK